MNKLKIKTRDNEQDSLQLFINKTSGNSIFLTIDENNYIKYSKCELDLYQMIRLKLWIEAAIDNIKSRNIEDSCRCVDDQGGPCSNCMESKYGL